MKLQINPNAYQQMRTHAEADYPNECCGFFYGHEGDLRQVKTALRVENAKEGDKSRRFQITPEDYRNAENYALEHELDLLGVYHSHPDHPAEPSEHDRKVALPWFSYIIISVENGKAVNGRSWRLNEDRQFEEEPIEEQPLSNTQKDTAN